MSPLEHIVGSQSNTAQMLAVAPKADTVCHMVVFLVSFQVVERV